MNEVAIVYETPDPFSFKVTVRHDNEICRKCLAQHFKASRRMKNMNGREATQIIEMTFKCQGGGMGMAGLGSEFTIDLTNMTNREHFQCVYGLELIVAEQK